MDGSRQASDSQLSKLAPGEFRFDGAGRIEGSNLRIRLGEWVSLEIEWSYDQRRLEITLDGESEFIPFAVDPDLSRGFSYLHLQSVDTIDARGFFAWTGLSRGGLSWLLRLSGLSSFIAATVVDE